MINHELVTAIARRTGASHCDVLAAFRESTAQDMADVRTAAAARDLALVALHAHRLRGASEMLGASGVGEAARLLEESTDSGREDGMHGALTALEREVQALDACLRTHAAGHGDPLP